MKKLMTLLILASITLFMSACATDKEKLLPEKTVCEKPTAPLQETYWKLTSFGMLKMAVSGKSHIILKQDGRVIGSGSCNRLMSSFTQDENHLSFSPAASTMMMCPDMNEERKFFQALGKVTDYKVYGESLDLYAEDKLVLRFKAVYLQ